MNDNPGIFDVASVQYRKGQRAIYRVCWIANLIVGQRNGQTAKLARALARSPDTVYKMARAAETYKRALSGVHDPVLRRRLRDARQSLDWSHLTTIGDGQARYEFPNLDTCWYLLTAAEDRLSCRRLSFLIDDERTGGEIETRATTRPWFANQLRTFALDVLEQAKLFDGRVKGYLTDAGRALMSAAQERAKVE